jgi:hypothetical protein
VLDVFGAAVDAREPATNDLKVRIAVGGKPTALALYETANTILVLDASQKRVTEIDARTNTVVGATTVEIAGTPTSISVDPSAGKILVTTESRPSSAAAKAPAGAVAVINGSTKQLETVREVEVAPRLVVPDPNGSRTALVSTDAITIVDSSYKVIDTLPGGVSAAFSRRGDTIAVLSASGTGSVLTFNGPGARDEIKFDGAPRAMTALPDGGYLVFIVAGELGRVTRIGQDGTLVGAVEIAITNGDLLYDQSTNRFTVASAGRLFSAEMPTQVAAVATQSASPSPTETSSAATSPSPSPPTVAVARTPEPSVASTLPNANLLAEAHPLGANLYTLPLPNGIQPRLVTAAASRLWVLDQSNGVHSFNTVTGDLFDYGKLRSSTHVGFWVASSSFVFGVDATNGEVNVVDLTKQRIDAYATNVLSPVSAVAVGLDNKLWIGLRDMPYLLVFDPTTRLMRAIDLGPARISALAVDSVGRVLYADDFRGTVGVIDQTTKLLNEVGFAKRGTTTALLVDNNSTLWLGTSAGEVYSVRGGTALLAVSLQRPVTALVVDRTGRAWYLAPLPSGFTGYIYAPADGSQAARSVPGPVVNLTFNAQGRALLADPRGGIYMSTDGAQ